MKIRFNWNDDLSSAKALEMHVAVIIIKSVFNINSKYHPQVFLDECLYKLGEYLYKCYIMIELMFMKVLILIIQIL